MAFPPSGAAPAAAPSPVPAPSSGSAPGQAGQITIVMSPQDVQQLQSFADFLQGIIGQAADASGQQQPGGDDPLAGLGAELDQMQPGR